MGAPGLTLIELLIGIFLLVGGVAVLLFGMHFAMIHSEYLSQMQVARNAAQGLLERLSVRGVETLMGVEFVGARPPNDGTRCALEDLDCNGTDDVAAGTIALPNGALIVQIKPNGNLPDLHVAACWQHRSRPIGEDLNCDGVVDVGEDANNNAWVDSPVMVSTRIGPKE